MIASKIFQNMEASSEMNKSRIELLDVVALTVDLPEYNLYCGQVGTVVELLASGAAFEVEFSDHTRINARAMPAAHHLFYQTEKEPSTSIPTVLDTITPISTPRPSALRK